MDDEIQEILRHILLMRSNESRRLEEILFALGKVVVQHLCDQQLDPNTYSEDQLTLMAVKALCERGVVIV